MKRSLKYQNEFSRNLREHSTNGTDCCAPGEYASQDIIDLMVTAEEEKGTPPVVKTNKNWGVKFVLDVIGKHIYHRGAGLDNSDNSGKPPREAIMASKLGKSYWKPDRAKNNTTIKHTTKMKTFQIKRILVPTDFSETGLLAIEHATLMARICQAKLHLLHVVEAFEYAISEYEPEVMVRDLEEVQEVATQKLEKIARELEKQHGIEVTTLLGNGRPAAGIEQAVTDNKIDLVIMGTHGAKGFEEYFIGSNAQKTVNAASCPVITIQTQAKNIGFSNIVMPIDNSPHSRQKVDTVIKLASYYGAKVHILGLMDSNEDIDIRKFNIKIDAVENAFKRAEVNYLKKTIMGSNIAVEAMKYSDYVSADLLVIMTDHESTLSGVFLGSLAKQVVNHSKVPVMSIKPHEGPYEDEALGGQWMPV